MGDQRPCAFQHHPQHCRVRAGTQGPVPRHTRLQPHVSHQCLTLPGLLLLSSSQGQAMSSVHSQARFLSESKPGKPRHGPFTPWRERASLGQRGHNPTSLLRGEPQVCPGGITSAFFPLTTGLKHPSHGCAAPKGAKHACPLRTGHINVQAGGRGHSDGLSPSAGTWVCHTPVTHLPHDTGEPLAEEIRRGLCRTASPGPAHRARSSSAAQPRPPPPPSSPARPGQAHGRRWC